MAYAQIIPLVRLENGFSTMFPLSSITIINGTGSGTNLSLGDISANIANYSTDKIAIYSNITSLQTSNTSIWTWIDNFYSNVTNLQTSNTSIWTWLGTNYLNVTALQTSNTSVWTWLGTNYLNVTSLQTSNTSIWTWLGTNYINVTGLQTSNTSTNARISSVNGTLNTLISNVSSIGNYSEDKTVLYLNVTGLNTTKVPYTGATGAVDLGAYNITAQNYSVTGSPGYISGNSTCIKMNFNSTIWFGVGSACQ